jgi:serine/threonine-protein kinase PpkA
VVHRDVKPDNLMVRGDGSVALADFGIAKHARNSFASTRHGEILGTPYYLSPEQCQGLAATPQSDLYSLGVLAYEMLTGAKPYRARSVEELLALHRTAEVPRLPGEFATWQPLIDRLMAKRRDERFAQAADVLAWLQENP